jgi:hypothetical protein
LNSQQCRLLFGSWAHSNESITFSLYDKNLSLIDFYDNQEWQLDLVNNEQLMIFSFYRLIVK